MAKRKKQQDEKENRKFSKPKLNLAPETTRGIVVVVFVAVAFNCGFKFGWFGRTVWVAVI